MTSEKQRRAFISYSRTNKEFAVKLTKGLRSAGFPVWFDQLDIPTGSRWDDEVEKALRECSIFLIILTPASIASENVKDEIGYAIDHGKRILPVLLEDCDVPLRLRRFQYVDFTTKNFEEGFESAKELLGDLVDEVSVTVATKTPVVEISTESKPEPAKEKLAQANSASAAPIQKKPISKGFVIGIIAVVVLIMAGIAFNAFSKSGNSSTAINGIPIVTSVDLRKDTSGKYLVIYQDIHFMDGDGDVTRADYVLVSSTITGLNLEGGPLDIPSAEQKTGTFYTGTWDCGTGDQYSLTLKVILTDKMGNKSEPVEYTLACGG